MLVTPNKHSEILTKQIFICTSVLKISAKLPLTDVTGGRFQMCRHFPIYMTRCVVVVVVVVPEDYSAANLILACTSPPRGPPHAAIACMGGYH